MKQLYERYKSGYSDSPERAIDFYNENLIFFNSITQFENADEISFFIKVYSEIITAFVKKYQYKNAIRALNILPAIEKAIDEFKIDRSEFGNYRWLLFQQATALYYLKHFVAAKKIFKMLLKNDFQNDNTKLWITYCWTGELQQYSTIFLVIAIIGLIGETVSKYTNMAIMINHIFGVLSGTSFIVFVILTAFIQWKRTKKII